MFGFFSLAVMVLSHHHPLASLTSLTRGNQATPQASQSSVMDRMEGIGTPMVSSLASEAGRAYSA
jgi:hypothetical protein